jgi:uncharacterized protein (TIGR02301 family)
MLAMKSAIRIILASVSLLALASAVAFAQNAAPEAAGVPVTESEPAAPAAASASDRVVAEDTDQDDGSKPGEDAPIDVPASARSDWAPDINLDAIGEESSAPAGPTRRAKPRKILSDAGENVLGTGSWSSSNANAEAELLPRSQRRARPIDPLKRSDLTKLSRVMGALHALRVSCSGRDDQTYRSRMATLLDLEAPQNADLRDPLVDAFNGGFQAYGRGASTCPTDARVQEASLAKEGFGLARALSTRYRPVPKVVAALPPASQPRQNVAAVPKAKEAAQATWNTGTAN